MNAERPGLLGRLKSLLFAPPRDEGALPAGAAGRWEDPMPAVAFGNRIILFGLGGFLLWAVLAPLDEGIPASGLVVVESKRKQVSHLTGGVVASIHVHENDQVQAGQVLLKMDDTQARVNHDNLLTEWLAVAIKLARLEAEQSFADRIAVPAEVQPHLEKPWAKDQLQAQEHLFRTRRQALRSEEAILRENLAATASQTQGTRQQLAARQGQTAALQEEITGMRSLVEEGYAPRTKLLEQERLLAEIGATTSELQANVARGANSSAELQLRILQRRQEYLKEVETQLAEARREVANLRERLRAATEELERTEVKAPAAGQVIALQAQTVGGTVMPGGRLMEIVPANDALLLDVQVAPHLINRIHGGLPADVRINAFPEDPQLVVDGRVQSVSSDLHTDPATQQAYFLARIEVTPAGTKTLAGRKLQPGMPVDVVVKTGERSFLAYLMKPLLQRMFSAFREA